VLEESVMPQVHRERGFAIYIYTHDHLPRHVHALKSGGVVIINLDDLSIRSIKSMKPAEVRLALEIVAEHREHLIHRWDEIRPLA